MTEMLVAKCREYLDIIFELSKQISAQPEYDAGNIIEELFEQVGDAEKYEGRVGQMQIAADLIDLEMLRQMYGEAESQYQLSMADFPEESEMRWDYADWAEYCQRRSIEVRQLGMEKLREAYPGLDAEKSSEKFFGDTTWARKRKSSKKSSERRPMDLKRVKMVERAVELRRELRDYF